MKTLGSKLGIVFFLSIGIGCSQTLPDNWSKRIISKQEKPLASWISPHASEANVLIIDGKRFEHVRGLSKFYLQAPEARVIVFVTDEKDYSITYHVFKMDTGEDIAIHAKRSLFGHTIGSAKPKDSIETADSQNIVLSNLDQGARSTLPSLANLDCMKSIYYLDLDKKTVSEKTLYLDKTGKVILERDVPARPSSPTSPASPAPAQ